MIAKKTTFFDKIDCTEKRHLLGNVDKEKPGTVQFKPLPSITNKVSRSAEEDTLDIIPSTSA